MSAVPTFASTDDALQALESALGYLATADPTQLPTAVQARCLHGLERADSVSTAARARFLGGFISAQGYCEDADCSPVMWLVNQTQVTRSCAAEAQTRRESQAWWCRR